MARQFPQGDVGVNTTEYARAPFYIGYHSEAPASIARRTRRMALLLVALAGAIAFAVALSQRPFDKSRFEFGAVNTFEGILVTDPYPRLIVNSAHGAASVDDTGDWLLVAPGKHGADAIVQGFSGKHVLLEGSRIVRAGGRAIEIVPGSVRSSEPQPAAPGNHEEFGPVRLSGEIVDSKCYYGVMNPGAGKVHRDCAVRCLSGGIPPSFAVTRLISGPPDSATVVRPGTILLVEGVSDAAGRTAILAHAGEPVTVEGTLLRTGGTLFLKLDAGSINQTVRSKE